MIVKLIYSEKATKFCKIFTLLLSYVVPVKRTVKILLNFMAFSEYINVNILNFIYRCAFCRFVFQYISEIFYLVNFEIVWYIFQKDIDFWSHHGKIILY